MSYKFLEPIQVGTQTIKNRVVYLAMAKMWSGQDGTVSPKDLAYISSLAQGGVGLIIPGGMNVDPTWPSQLPMQPGIYSDHFLPGLMALAETGHQNGAKILFQLWHGGEVNYSGVQPPTINDISVEKIHEIQDKFEDAAKRAIAAGADGIEFQMCHTYLANQFLSPLWNHRTDEYGIDTLENQLRFSIECITRLRKAIGPDKILAVKMQGYDCAEGGITPELTAKFAPYVEKAGADMITVSGGGSLTDLTGMSGDGKRAEGWKVPGAKAVKEVVSIPVAASGSIRHPEYANSIIADGSCDMVGIGRGIFAEREWVNKCAEGREDEMRYCISCLNCWNFSLFPEQSNCSVNPWAGRELEQKPLRQDGDGRVVAIVGAGPAGMEAAVTLKQRGFEPVVFEKGSKIGGNVHLAKMPPNKYKFQWAVGYYERMAKKLGLDIRFDTEATAENILALDPYAVLIAAGSNVSELPVEGLTEDKVIQSRTILENNMELSGKKLVLIGGGLTGVESALYLRYQGNEVSVVDFAPPPSTSQLDAMNFMMEAALDYGHALMSGIQLYYKHKVVCYKDGKLIIEGVEDGERKELEADLVVLSTGVKPNDSLYWQLLMGGRKNVYKVGDANFCDKIVKAVQAGSKFGTLLK